MGSRHSCAPGGKGDDKVKIAGTIIGVMMAIATIPFAGADEISTQLRALLTDPQTAFVALRGERQSTVWPRWKAKPIIPNAACEVVGGEDGPDVELRCVIDKPEAEAYADGLRKTIDRTLGGLSIGRGFKREDSNNNADQFQGICSTWSYRSKTDSFEIEVINGRAFGAARTTFSVKHQKL